MQVTAQVTAQNAGALPFPFSADFNIIIGLPNNTAPQTNNIMLPTDSLVNLTLPNGKVINTKLPQPTLTNSASFGCGLEGTYNIMKSNLSIGAGVFFSYQKSAITLDAFQVAYKSSDAINNYKFIQILTSIQPIKETITNTGISVPILIKYRHKITKRIELNFAGGALLNLLATKKYTVSNAVFNYEAIYYFNKSANNNTTTPAYYTDPDASKWYIIDTNQFQHPSMGDTAYFNNLHRNSNLNVGLYQKPNTSSGTMQYKTDVGIYLRTQVAYHYSPNISFLVGVAYSTQTYNQQAEVKSRITDKIGEYNTLLNSLNGWSGSAIQINFGVRYILFRK